MYLCVSFPCSSLSLDGGGRDVDGVDEELDGAVVAAVSVLRCSEVSLVVAAARELSLVTQTKREPQMALAD